MCNGKIVVTGTVNGNTNSSEFFADVAKVEGEIVSTGTVKIGAGSVIIGNISASSAVIAGAVKGDIDVQGPVVVDTSAVIWVISSHVQYRLTTVPLSRASVLRHTLISMFRDFSRVNKYE